MSTQQRGPIECGRGETGEGVNFIPNLIYSCLYALCCFLYLVFAYSITLTDVANMNSRLLISSRFEF